ncbi:MAG: aminotransferase class V-fold PLP-dependent enzyme [Desulfobulbaceae bacterium]|nr:MAG: aminotransferase class V-fold PLP-dependent enzyme [Desulfobulbaceae bacterium]
MIYLDNAATTWPKDGDCLRQALEDYLRLGASPGRGGYDLAVESEEAVTAVRSRIAKFFGAGRDARICFAANATDALNTLILGLATPGAHIVSSRLEHNSVLRPLHHLERQGLITLTLVPFDAGGFIDPAAVAAAIRPATRLVVLTHASNVLGTVQPVAEIGAICRRCGVPLVIDAAQSAGMVPIDMRAWDVQGLVFTGHKSLLGPTGIGGMVLGPGIDPLPSRFGGTGIDSANPFQPLAYPERLEAGTINLLGILALGRSLAAIEHRYHDDLSREMALLRRLRDGFARCRNLRLIAAENLDNHLPILTCAVEGMSSIDVGAILDGDFGIAVRAGLHCAPLVHTDLGTQESGTVRFSLGQFTTEAEIAETVRAMTIIAG